MSEGATAQAAREFGQVPGTHADRLGHQSVWKGPGYAEHCTYCEVCPELDALTAAADGAGRQVLHRTGRMVHVSRIPAGTWVWDDRNDEPALAQGWSTREGCYIFTWLSAGDWCAWDLDCTGRPHTFELMRVEREV